MSNSFLVERITQILDKMSGNSHFPKQSKYFDDFLSSLMTGSYDPLPRRKLNEVTLYDANKENKYPLLKHQAVAQTRPEDRQHTDMYKRLMDRGEQIDQRIRKEHGSINKHISNGFRQYMENVGQGHNSFEDPRETQSTELRKARAAFKEHVRQVGYLGKSAPNFIGGNTKTEKNVELGDITAGLSLSPAGVHGMGNHTSCPKSTKECRNSCLGYTTGQNAMLSNVNSKIAKHHFFAEHPEHAARLIHSELLDHIDNVAKWNSEKGPKEKPLIASYRPNMVSDYNHADISHDMINHVTEYARRKGVKFQVRDYTKRAELLNKPRPKNYFLALSHTGQNRNPVTGKKHDESNDEAVGKALDEGHTVASIVNGDATHMYDAKRDRLYKMVEGDNDDQIENRGKQAGLKQKEDGTHVDKNNRPTGVVSVLRVKGISKKVQEAAGNFENQTETINHPKYGKIRAVVINREHK